MASSQISSWAHSSSGAADDDQLESSATTNESWRSTNVLDDWDNAVRVAQRRLLSSSSKGRIQFLQDDLTQLVNKEELSMSQIMDVFGLVADTYYRYVDSASRDAVETLAVELVRQDERRDQKLGVTEQVLAWMKRESQQAIKTHPPVDVFILLSWQSSLYATCVSSTRDFVETNPTSWQTLTATLADLLFYILDPSLSIKPGLTKSALVRVRRAIRARPRVIPQLLATLLASNDKLRALPLLGLVLDVAIHLKDPKHSTEQGLDTQMKADILSTFATTVFSSRNGVPPHAIESLNLFLSSHVTEEDLVSQVLPTVEKAILRSPEYTLSAIAQVIRAFNRPLTPPTFATLLTPAINNTKSANALIRSGSVALVKALLLHNSEQSAALVTEAFAIKSTGVEHRLALYAILDSVTPSLHVSKDVFEKGSELLVKENSEEALQAVASVLATHLAFLLENQVEPSPSSTSILLKEIQSSAAKPLVRRASVEVLGGALWRVGGTSSGKWVADTYPALEGLIKQIVANPLNTAIGAVESFIALCVLTRRVGAEAEPLVKSVFTGSATKSAFLFMERFQSKIGAADEQGEIWLLRATDAAFIRLQSQVAKESRLRSDIGRTFLRLAVDSSKPKVRQATCTQLAQNAKETWAVTLNTTLREAIEARINISTTLSQSDGTSERRRTPLANVLSAIYSLSSELDSSTLERLLSEGAILGHHADICGASRQWWIELCQRCGVDLEHLVNSQIDLLMEKVRVYALTETDKGFAEAAYRLVTTMAFVSPRFATKAIVEQIKADIDTESISALTDFDLAVYQTPEGTTLVDVLANKKGNTDQSTKGKDAAMAKWDADIRKSLAERKTTTKSNLSKADQALVQTQLETEAAIRARVGKLKMDLERGLYFVQSLVQANIFATQNVLTGVASLVLSAGLRCHGLSQKLVISTYTRLSDCCSARLADVAYWVAIATLRSSSVADIQEDLQTESLSSLLSRLLYRLRSISEQAPLDATSFAFVFSLLESVLRQVNAQESDELMEGITLALDIIAFHCGEYHDPKYPRVETISRLISISQAYTNLSKQASTALINLGQAIHDNATSSELQTYLDGLLYQEVQVRNACLQALQPFDLTDLDWSTQLWIASHDDDEPTASLALHIWEDNGLDVAENFLSELSPFLDHPNAYVRQSTAAAIANALEQLPAQAEVVVNSLQEYYREKAKLLAPEYDEYGMVIASTLDRSDPWPCRLATALAFEHSASYYSSSSVEPFFIFLIQDQALGDRSAEVRRAMLKAGSAVIDEHGAEHLGALIKMFETQLSGPPSSSETEDQIKEAVVILFGRVARHLKPSDPRISAIVERLIDALKTPSEQVQLAVSDCIAPLVPLIRPTLQKLVDDLFQQLFTAQKYAARRGAAYGLSGIFKGTGISAFKEYDVIRRLQEGVEDKKQTERRQGAMFAFETLSMELKRLFEPYISHILPLLLASFGDAAPDVREATQDAARVIMSNMSGYGIKLMLEPLLSGLDEKQWRTKKGSIELLGMMAYCSPKQLSVSLPIVIPRLTGVLTDSHAQVRGAANKSLKQFGDVISNPEIQSLVPQLLKAFVDPAKVQNALSSLLKKSFLHYIDESSLALVVPIIDRGLRERGSETKKKAAQIVGNLASLTDSKDFVPYLSTLLPLVLTVLVDPVPEARATAAKSLGTLVERLGEGNFPDLIPGLLRTLKTDTSGVDRQGAAQGLSEVLSALGMERLEGLLPDIISNAQSPRSTVREGFMSLLVYLPATFGSRFSPHLPKILPPIVSGLADSEEYVREAAMRAGRMIVTQHSSKAVELLLPQLENGMFDAGWRIRLSSIQLVGELLFKVSGITGKAGADENEVEVEAGASEASRRALTEVLGVERRDRILSALYLARQDAVNVVRTASINIWKALVQNTPRTVRELLPQLLSLIVFLISGDEFEQQETSTRTVAEICRKFGEKTLAQIVPVLKSKSSASDARTREGVCLTLCAVVENSGENQRDDHEDAIISIVRDSLVDDEPNVRVAAAKAFDVLQEHLGVRAIDQTIPTLLEALRQPGASSGTALQALREVMSVRATTVFPTVLTTLVATPMTIFNARALASLITVAEEALSKRVTLIVTALAKVLESNPEEDLQQAVDEALRALFTSISDNEGLNTIMLTLLGWAKHTEPARRVKACEFFALFCEVETQVEISDYYIDWIRQLVSLLDDSQVSVHTAAWQSLDAFVKSIPKDELEPLVPSLRRTIESTGPPGHLVAGFSLPKGVAPMVPIIIAGLTTGNHEQRESAAYAIGDLVERTEQTAIKPFVVPFCGPLIRVATQTTTYPPGVKTALLSALLSMLERIPVFIKPFYPQLQRTFIKSTSDSSSVAVRTKAADAIGELMKHQTRVDPVITELLTGAKTPDEAIAASQILALANVISSSGANAGQPARASCLEFALAVFQEDHEDTYLGSVAELNLALASDPDFAPQILSSISSALPSPVLIQTVLGMLKAEDEGRASFFSDPNELRKVAEKVKECLGSDKHKIFKPAREARDVLRNGDHSELLGGLF